MCDKQHIAHRLPHCRDGREENNSTRANHQPASDFEEGYAFRHGFRCVGHRGFHYAFVQDSNLGNFLVGLQGNQSSFRHRCLGRSALGSKQGRALFAKWSYKTSAAKTRNHTPPRVLKREFPASTLLLEVSIPDRIHHTLVHHDAWTARIPGT